ncbi:MAG: hypothetical protein JW913_05550 [Chitinispirillaceae bacterium]|nr:hypothetical protein [Chitinispirillaceae bacterium]
MEDRQIMSGRWRFVDVVAQAPLEIDYRILSAYAWVGKVEFQVKYTFKENKKGKETPPPPIIKTYPSDERHTDPWVYAVRFRPEPGTAIEVTLIVDNKVQLSEKIDIGVQLNLAQTQQLTPHASRLVRAINTTPTGCPAYTDDQDKPDAKIDTTTIQNILNWIWHKLDGGFDPVWLGPDGGRGLALDEMNLSTTELQSEEWARGYSELAVGSRYGGAESAWYFFLFNGDKTDGPSTRRMADRRDAGNGRSWFPVGFACQQMSTLGLMLGNYPYVDFSPALNAGGSLALPVFNTKGGHAYGPGEMAGDPPKSIRTPRGGLNATPPVCPGTVYEFYKTPSVGGAHIGTLIRVHPDPTGWCGIQSIDTGGLNAPNRDTPENFNNRNYDDPWLLNDDPVHGIEPFKGVGVPYPNTPLSLATIRTWWPIGFARLVLRRRSDKTVLYATPMLRMHYQTQGFPLGLYGWSLRGRPYAPAIEALWQITIPQSGFARTAVDSGPDITMTQLLQAAGIPTDHPETPLRPTGPGGGQRLFFFASIQVNANDHASRVETPPAVNIGISLPWGVRSKHSSAPDFPPLTNVPPYFRGDE